MLCCRKSRGWKASASRVIVNTSLLKRVEARYAGSRDVVRVAYHEGQPMHVGGSGNRLSIAGSVANAFIRTRASATF